MSLPRPQKFKVQSEPEYREPLMNKACSLWGCAWHFLFLLCSCFSQTVQTCNIIKGRPAWIKSNILPPVSETPTARPLVQLRCFDHAWSAAVRLYALASYSMHATNACSVCKKKVNKELMNITRLQYYLKRYPRCLLVQPSETSTTNNYDA